MTVSKKRRRRELSIEDHVAGVLACDRVLLARTITLVESNHPLHQEKAQQVLTQLLSATGKSHRIGISGVPGVGKSTFIESFGLHLLSEGHKVAVLAVDPTSSLRGGSILGDKTRMTQLASDQRAFIRPSPSQGTLGGVHRKTRETMLLCEAAGFDVILVETVGVGQSETAVAEMVDTYLVLMLAGAGDELQGIKKGILEVADLLAINKADGNNLRAANRAKSSYRNALHLIRPKDSSWRTPVLTCSALQREGLVELWGELQRHKTTLQAEGHFAEKRKQQKLRWFWSIIEQGLLERFRRHPVITEHLGDLEQQILSETTTPTQAAIKMLNVFEDQDSLSVES